MMIIILKLVFVQVIIAADKDMRDIPGTPKTLTGFCLRIAQLIFAIASLYLSDPSCLFLSSYRNFIICFVILQSIWSYNFISYFLTYKCGVVPLPNTELINAMVIITVDLVMAFLGLAYASASFGVAMLYAYDDKVQLYLGPRCHELIWMSSVSALLCCSTSFASFLVVLWATALANH